MTRLAAVDIGTNTVRMLIAEPARGGMRPIARFRSILGMGRQLRETGKIGEEQFRQGIRTLHGFLREMDRHRVSAYRACGTACLREAANREDFLSEARKIGMRIDVISPTEEGRLAWKGIREALGARRGDIAMDIGGGSTEITVGPGRDETVSLPMGVVVLSSLLPLSDPPEPWEWKALCHYADRRIQDGTNAFRNRRHRRLIGTAGTFTTLAAIDRAMVRYDPAKINGAFLSRAKVSRWAEKLASMTDAQRLRLRGMEKGRERYIVPGASLIRAAVERLGVDGVTVSDAGLLEGVIAGLV